MKRLIFGVAAALCLASGQAAADGLPSRGHVSSYEPAGPNWNGFSAGLGVGATAAVTELSGGGASFDGVGGEGVIGSISVGYDRVLSPRWVAGLFTDYTFGGAETDLNLFGFGVSFDQNYSWAIGARLGFLTNPSTLVYGTAGYTQSEFEVSLAGLGSADQTFGGYFVGAGIETYLRSNWTAKLEYRFSQYDGEDFGINGLDVEPSTHAVRAVLSYKFGGPRD